MNSENRTDRKSLHSRIYELVDQVPAGRVATYGQIAKIVGCGARVVGYALASLPIGRPLCLTRTARGKYRRPAKRSWPAPVTSNMKFQRTLKSAGSASTT